MKMRALGISAISVAMTAAVISNAYYQKKQFYPSVVYITKSNPSMAVIYIQSLVLVLMLGKLMRKVFLGSLRAAEFEHLMERFWYALTETCLAFTVFRDDFNPKFVALFTVLLFLKSFHWLAEDRVDYMERSPVIGWLFHVRVSALLSVLGMLDYMMISHAYYQTIAKGPTVQLVFGFEYAILITMVANTAIKYVLHAAELRADSPWENKAVFLLYTELVIGFIRVVLYVLFVVIMVRIYTLPLFAFRPMYYTMRNFKKALNDVILSRRAIRNMNTLYPDATPEELSDTDNICIICREDMVNSSKKLPCGHIFHTSCLRSWFQRQQTCPTCRLNILRAPTAPVTAAAAAVAQNNDPNQPNAPGIGAANIINNNNNIPQPDANIFANLLGGAGGGVGAGVPGLGGMAGPQPLFPNLAGAAGGGGSINVGGSPFMAPPMGFPFLSPYMLPPPPMPPSLDTLTEDELRRLEGNERTHVEERIKLLRNIQLMLDASVSLMNQYSAITAKYPPPAPPIPVATDIQPPATVPTSTSTPAASSSTLGIASSSTSSPSEGTSPVASTSSAQDIPSTSKEHPVSPKTSLDDNLVKIEDLGSEEHIDSVNTNVSSSSGDSLPSSEADVLRRRRLQKFVNTDQQRE